MKTARRTWNKLGITGKFSLAFSMVLVLLMIITATGYFSLRSIHKAEHRIRKSTAIEQLVLEMDRGLEKARRLHGNFFLQYPYIGLEAAHETYAQPSVREIARVISLSSKLKKLLFQSNSRKLAEINRADINLYLSSAQRFAETSIEAVELLAKRAAPKRGLEAQLEIVSLKLDQELQSSPMLQSAFTRAMSSYNDYLVNRHRFLMQSTLNILAQIGTSAEEETSLTSAEKTSIADHLKKYETLAEDLLDVDLAISSKLRDFSLQNRAVSPLSQNLIRLTQEEVDLAGQRIEHVHRAAIFVMLTICLMAIFAVLFIATLMHHSVTKNVLKITAAAGEFSTGKLDVRIQNGGQDELGRLGDNFNTMAARLQDLVENLERKVAQRTAELSASEQRFRHLVNDLPKIAVQGYNRERKAVYWNHTSELLYGYSEEEAIGRRLEELIIPEPLHDEIVKAVQDWFEKDIAPPASEIILENKDGGKVPVYTSHVMLTNYLGEKTIYCVDIDLAELKLAQEEGRKIEYFYRQLFDHSTSGVAVYAASDDGQDFIFKDINKAGEKIDQVTRDGVIGHSVMEIFPGSKEFGLLSILRKVWRTGEPEYHPISFYKDERMEGWRENRVYKLPSGEIVSVFDDVTAQKHAEWEKQAMEYRLTRAQKMEAIGLLAGGVAHDLNNILSAVVGYPELLLLDLPEDSELRQPLEATKEAGERATAVVADLLTVARGVASVKEPRDLNVLVREYLKSPEFIKLRSQHPSVEFRQQLDTDLPAIRCSPVHVKKSIMNLVTNGAEALEATGTVTLATRKEIPDQRWADERGLDPGEYVILTISDTGRGIPAKDLDHIFEPFYTKKVMGHLSGTGLGLSVVWNAMQDHRGAVEVSRTDGITSFALYFPSTSEPITATGRRDRDMNLQGRGETILVVDDEPQQRDLARSMLTILGYKATCQDSGEKGLAYLQDHQVDLVILDMLMDPGMNGRKTYERMLEIRPGQRAIVASGFSESDEVKIALSLGAGRFIQKPYSIEQLGQAVKEVLNG